MDNLKAKWNSLERPVQIGIAAAAVVAMLVFVFKVLPTILDIMSVGALIALLILPYWIPTIVAFVRHHPSKGGVAAMNLFLGWTFIGWVLALIWSFSDNTSRGPASQTVIVNTAVTTATGSSAPVYQAGDVVNGHRFDGTQWTPLPAAPQPPAIAAAHPPVSNFPHVAAPSALANPSQDSLPH